MSWCNKDQYMQNMQKNFTKILTSFFLFFSFHISESSLNDLSFPYCDLKTVLPFDNHGWYSNSEWIEKLMTHNKVTTVVEVASWLGLSTRHIASLLQPNGKLYAVDTWQGSIEHHEIPQYAAKLPTLYEQFLSNMIHAKLTDIVIPVKMTSQKAAKVLFTELNSVDLIYIDAGHDTQSVFQDIQVYWPYVKNNQGILCGDDWWHDPVKVAVRIFAQAHHLTIYASDNFWFVKKEAEYTEKDFKHEDITVWKFENLQ